MKSKVVLTFMVFCFSEIPLCAMRKSSSQEMFEAHIGTMRSFVTEMNHTLRIVSKNIYVTDKIGLLIDEHNRLTTETHAALHMVDRLLAKLQKYPIRGTRSEWVTTLDLLVPHVTQMAEHSQHTARALESSVTETDCLIIATRQTEHINVLEQLKKLVTTLEAAKNPRKPLRRFNEDEYTINYLSNNSNNSNSNI